MQSFHIGFEECNFQSICSFTSIKAENLFLIYCVWVLNIDYGWLKEYGSNRNRLGCLPELKLEQSCFSNLFLTSGFCMRKKKVITHSMSSSHCLTSRLAGSTSTPVISFFDYFSLFYFVHKKNKIKNQVVWVLSVFVLFFFFSSRTSGDGSI